MKYLRNLILLGFILGVSAQQSEAQERFTKWIIKENPKNQDTLFIKENFFSDSIQLYLSSGKRDSISIISVIPNKAIVIQLVGYPFEKKLILGYDIPQKQLFSDKIEVLPKHKSLNENESLEELQKSSHKTDNPGDLFGNSKLKKNGSLTRGITVGSNQDASLESGLRLDLSGEIADSVFLIANLTDQSTPIQPDGSTQNLREFDRVYLQLKSPNHLLEMGDIDVGFNQSRFAKINRRLQGANYSTTSIPGKYSFLASVARGIFRNQTIQAQEAFQGPYRLMGQNGETFIIVIAGTERVFVDGRLLTRGEENDYIIDYSLGEVVFTSKVLINTHSRISIDFQYMNQDFSRTLIAAEAKSDPFWDDKLQIGVSFMRETDSDNSLSQLSLGDEEISILELAGDDPQKAVVSGVVPYFKSDESNQRIPYERRDTVIGGDFYSYYKAKLAENGSPTKLFFVQFSRVQDGFGAYERAESGLNGVVFKWVGNGLGRYDTLRTLPRPQDHLMLAVQADIKPTKTLKISSEVALSQFDLNRFSSIDDSDNEDWAIHQKIEHQTKLDWAEIQSSYALKYSGEKFRYFDRPEEVDFQRKWNLNQFVISDQTVQDVATKWNFTKNTSYKVELGVINRKDMEGWRAESDFKSDEENHVGFTLKNEITSSKDKILNTNGDWNYHQTELFYRWKSDKNVIRPFVGALLDERKQKQAKSDSVLFNSYGQYAAEVGLEWLRMGQFKMNYTFKVRDDASFLNYDFKKDSRNKIHQFGFNTIDSKQFETENTLSYQMREVTPTFRNQAALANSDAVFIKSNSRYRSSSRAIDAQFFYDVNSQRTAILQETYIEVGPELGQYVWDDLNNDGIRQIDEFFPEQTPNEGLFLKQYLPSDELLPSINLISRARLQVDPSRAMSDKNRNDLSYRILEQISGSTTLDIRENSTTSKLSDIYFLRLNRFLNDSTTLAGRIGVRSELVLFQKNTAFSLRLGMNHSKGKNRQAFGTENNNTTSYSIESTSFIQRKWQLSTSVSLSKDERENTSLNSRNYAIRSNNYGLNVNYQFSRDAQIGSDFGFSSKKDGESSQKATSEIIKVGLNTRLFIGDKIQSSARIQFRNVNLNGNSGAMGNFELTEGAGEGQNWIWSMQATYRNSQFMQTSFNYDGRTNSGRPTIHTVRLVVRALF